MRFALRFALIGLLSGWAIAALAAGTPSAIAGQKSTAPESAPSPPPPETTASMAEQVFQQSLRQLFPLSPAQIHTARKQADQQKAAEYGGPPPKMGTRTVKLNVMASAQPPTVHLALGYVTTLLFIDATGAPWPLTSDTVGAPTAFWVSHDPKTLPGNLLVTKALMSHVASNLVVTLKNYDFPITIILDQDSTDKQGVNTATADGLVEFEIPSAGPLAEAPMLTPGAQPVPSQVMYAFLDDMAPEGAEALTLAPALGEAWLYKRALYYRTQLSVVWPAWSGHARAPGAVSVYSLPVVPQIMVTKDGSVVTLVVSKDGQPLSGAALETSGAG